MGGTVRIAIAAQPAEVAPALADCARTAARIDAWGRRLSRFTDSSDLTRLNRTGHGQARVRPTLGAALAWAKAAEMRSGGLADATLLDVRLAAQCGQEQVVARREWEITACGRSALVHRKADFAIDLDGFAKGWLADRATNLLARWPGAAVDADGDIAITAAPGIEWLVGVADPTRADSSLATIRLTGGSHWNIAYGVATSGTSVHRWQGSDGQVRHHLIDPRTCRSAETDVVQATVVAPSGREAEMLAKSAVILGSEEALGHLDRSAALTAILLLNTGEVVALPGVERWLA
jgi:thiamine biosynthesis lipoprotein ApbE